MGEYYIEPVGDSVFHRAQFIVVCRPWLYAAPERKRTDSESNDSIVKRFMEGEYDAVYGMYRENHDDMGRLVGCLVYKADGGECVWKLLYARGHYRQLFRRILEGMRDAGYTHFTFESSHNRRMYERTLGVPVKKLYSKYEVTL